MITVSIIQNLFALTIGVFIGLIMGFEIFKYQLQKALHEYYFEKLFEEMRGRIKV